MDGPWAKTPGFSVDHYGSHSIYLKKQIDFENIQSIFTRDKPEYLLVLPKILPNSGDGVSEVGIVFETDWTLKNIIVLKVLSGSWASGHDIQIGDVLLEVRPLSHMN